MYTFTPIGTVESCYKENFAIPRQPGLVKSAWGKIKLKKDFRLEQSLIGLEGFSHLWIVFVFHYQTNKDWKPSVRPPRLGGAKKIGVLASRSPHRPNPIGLSVVKLKKIEKTKFETIIHIEGHDFLEGAPVLDIKPYIAYSDALKKSSSGWANAKIKKTKVRFLPSAIKSLKNLVLDSEKLKYKKLITELVSIDPRPAFQKKKSKMDATYAFRLEGLDIHWRPDHKYFTVTEIKKYEKIK